ncbi:MAG: hypothetical protein DRQ78_08485 [Epsilonproteobacteria bacterium]|nr:MAG: hypothetical protein DRQ78_08485 [Campylobacterota bacterium]
MNIYIDAAFDKYSKVAWLGYCNDSMTLTGIKKIKASNINEAELSALCFAIRKIGADWNFLTDSMSVVNQCACENVSHVPRLKNLADAVVAIGKENIRNK